MAPVVPTDCEGAKMPDKLIRSSQTTWVDGGFCSSVTASIFQDDLFFVLRTKAHCNRYHILFRCRLRTASGVVNPVSVRTKGGRYTARAFLGWKIFRCVEEHHLYGDTGFGSP